MNFLQTNSNGDPEPDNTAPLREAWSPAARAAAAASRKRKGQGMGARRQAAHAAYNSSLGANFPHGVRALQRNLDMFVKSESTARTSKRKAAKGRQADRIAKRLYKHQLKQNPERYHPSGFNYT